ncbi:hypothetical protein AAG906_022128 [Vitis piasezkii]
MCGGDDHLTWKCPVSLKIIRSRFPLLHVGASEDPILPFLISNRECSEISASLSFIRVDDRLFCIIDQIDMDPQTITVDQFTTTMASVQETTISKDVHARMDCLEHSVAWDDSDGIPVANLPAYVDISRRELKTLRQGSDESVYSFSSCWREKFVQVIDQPTEREQIQMVVRILQPKIARHVIGVPFTDFGYLVMTLFSYRQSVPPQPFDWTYSYFTPPKTGYANQFIGRPSTSIPRAKPPHLSLSLSPSHHNVIDWGSISLDQLGVTSNLVIFHSTHAVPPSTISIPSIDHVDDDGVQMMRSKDTESKPIILDERSHGGY